MVKVMISIYFSWAPHELGLILVAGSSDGSISTLTYTGGSGTGGQQWESDKIMSAHMIGCNAVSWSVTSCYSCNVG